MKKQFSFLLLAAALLVSVPSWAERVYVEGEKTDFKELGMPLVEPDEHGAHFGTICVPEQIIAQQGIKLFDVVCVDVDPLDTTQVARLCIGEHPVCHAQQQENEDGDHMYCPGVVDDEWDARDPCEQKAWIDWETFLYFDAKKSEKAGHDVYSKDKYRTVAGAAYFYQVCDDGADSLVDRKIWVDKSKVASEPVCQNGFYGTFANTYIAEPIVVLSQDKDGVQYLEKAKQVTMPARRGYFKGNFECVPWRYNTHSPNFTEEFQKAHGVTTSINPRHNPCTGEIYDDDPVSEAPSRMVAFNVGRNATTGLYQVDFEHPIYLGKETNKRIENGQLILEAADGTKYNAFGQRVQ